MNETLAQILALVGGGTTLSAIGLLAYLVYRGFKLADERDNLRDTVETKDTLIAQTREEIAGVTSQLAAVRAQLQTERDLRAAAESQRNEAFKAGVTHAVSEINRSDVPGAVELGNRVLTSSVSALQALAAANNGGQGAIVQPAGASTSAG